MWSCRMRTLSARPGQMFGQLPSNATAGEGTSAEFSCSVLSNDPSPTRLDSVWAVLVPGNIELILGINGVRWVALRDNSTAFIGPTFSSPLTIANVTRSLEGTRVRCFFFVGVDPTSQPEPYAFLTVLCKLWLPNELMPGGNLIVHNFGANMITFPSINVQMTPQYL